MLKPQDILFLLKLVSLGKPDWTFASLADELHMSSSEVHAGFKRSVKAHLIHPRIRLPNISALEEFLIHGIRYIFPAERGELTRGMVTAHAASPLKELLVAGDDLPPVWPFPAGSARGFSFSPLYPSAPRAALSDKNLYELLALVDAIRGGGARERRLAGKELHKRLAGVKDAPRHQ